MSENPQPARSRNKSSKEDQQARDIPSRTRLTKLDIIARDAELRSRPFKSPKGNAAEEVLAGSLRVAARLKLRFDYASARGQRRGEGVRSRVKRKNCNINRKK